MADGVIVFVLSLIMVNAIRADTTPTISAPVPQPPSTPPPLPPSDPPAAAPESTEIWIKILGGLAALAGVCIALVILTKLFYHVYAQKEGEQSDEPEHSTTFIAKQKRSLSPYSDQSSVKEERVQMMLDLENESRGQLTLEDAAVLLKQSGWDKGIALERLTSGDFSAEAASACSTSTAPHRLPKSRSFRTSSSASQHSPPTVTSSVRMRPIEVASTRYLYNPARGRGSTRATGRQGALRRGSVASESDSYSLSPERHLHENLMWDSSIGGEEDIMYETVSDFDASRKPPPRPLRGSPQLRSGISFSRQHTLESPMLDGGSLTSFPPSRRNPLRKNVRIDMRNE
eukprot:Sspe_Gene.73423::Locus_44312_Transcript_1_1_Confidence_1.000_Length_1418::g.73423::m.73423